MTSSGSSHGGYGGALQFGADAVAFLKRNEALRGLHVAVAFIATPLQMMLLSWVGTVTVSVLPDDRKSNIVLANSTVTPGGELRTHS